MFVLCSEGNTGQLDAHRRVCLNLYVHQPCVFTLFLHLYRIPTSAPLPPTPHCLTYFRSFLVFSPLAGSRKHALLLLLWRFDFVISLMQSEPGPPAPHRRKPPPITTEPLSFHTKTQSFCLKKEVEEKMGGMRDGWDGGETETDSKTSFTAFNVELNGTFQKNARF